jgi:hypothetical protein
MSKLALTHVPPLTPAKMLRIRYNKANRRKARTAMHPEIIEVTAGEVSDKLKRLGIGSDELVKITIEPERELIPGRREARARVVAAGLTDDDIDRLIKQAQHDVEPRPHA